MNKKDTMNIPVIETILQNQAAFLFILVRVAAFLTAIPLIGGAGVPNMVKVMIVLSMTLMLFQVIEIQPGKSLNLVTLTIGVLGEVLVGLILSLGVNFLFAAVELGSEIAGMQMGFGSANLFDPISNKQASLIARLEGLVAMLVFLSINGHFIILENLTLSFELLPSFGFFPTELSIEYLMDLVGNMFLLALKIAAPVIVTLLLANVVIGIFSRVIPQLNVLLFSFPVTIILGLLILGLSLPVFVSMMTHEISQLRTVLPGLLIRMQP